MRPKSMILIVIALGCGLIASIGISQVIKAPEEQPVVTVATDKIYVAIRDVDLGQLLLPDMVQLEEWPADKIPEGAIRDIEAINDRRTLVRLYPGEPIMMAKMIDKDKFHDPTQQIPPGYRVVSVAVNAMVTAGNLVKPGDKVDLVLFIKAGRNEIKQTVARTILQNIKVFAVNTQIRRSSEGGDDGPINAKHVSFLVKPDEAQKIMLATELGKLKLSLRRSDEETDDGFNDTTVADLFAQPDDDENTEQPSKDPNSNKSDITGFLAGMIASPAEVVDSNDGWEMTILNGRGQATVYGWKDKGQLPTLLSGEPAIEEAAAENDLPFDQDDPTSALSDEATADDWLESNPIEPLN